MTVQDLDRTHFAQDWAGWHRQHEARLADEHGFLAITSLNWLTDRAAAVPRRAGNLAHRPGRRRRGARRR